MCWDDLYNVIRDFAPILGSIIVVFFGPKILEMYDYLKNKNLKIVDIDFEHAKRQSEDNYDTVKKNNSTGVVCKIKINTLKDTQYIDNLKFFINKQQHSFFVVTGTSGSNILFKIDVEKEIKFYFDITNIRKNLFGKYKMFITYTENKRKRKIKLPKGAEKYFKNIL
ncbi:MAG: hypothetical protein JETCAE03_32500 [Ignavibacteriaceae bacterium]|nr:MAG: hypothetical protein JETCAE03_32500 [Ignavibacteriaceae bacterium]